MNAKKIGFFSLFDTETPDSYVGALLVTDDNGIPIEFKCTHSVKPTAIQKTLYGEKLKPYISITLCGIPLLQNISNKPDILFIDTPSTIGIRSEINTPTFLVRRIGESITFQDDETNKRRLESNSGLFQAVILQGHPDKKEESDSFKTIIDELFNHFDLIEPFDRMKMSIEILGKNDTRFK